MNELNKKLNLAVTETNKINKDNKIFHFSSLVVKFLELPRKYREKTTTEEQIWNSWGFAVDERNNIIGDVIAKRK